MNKLLSSKTIKDNPEKYIKFMCYDVLISIDNQVFTLSMKLLKEQLIGGSYCYYCNKKYRTKTWIRKNCIKVLGFVTE